MSADDFPYYPNPAERDELMQLDRMFRLAADHPISTKWRFEADQCYKFEAGDQWSESEKAILLERNQPILVENEVRPTIERLQGQFRRQRTNIKFLGRTPQTEQKAQTYSDLLRHIDYVNQVEFIENDCIKDQLRGGIGWMEACIHQNELGQNQVRYRWEDPFTMFVDPFCRTYDINVEARYVCRAKWFDEDIAVQLWGEAKYALIRQVLGTSQPSLSNLSNIDPDSTRLRNWEIGRYYDTKNRRFRPVEIWYKKRATEYIIQLDDGTITVVRKPQTQNSLNEDGVTTVTTPRTEPPAERPVRSQLDDALAKLPGSVVTERTVDQMWVAVYCGGLFLDGPKPSPYKHDLFPFIPYYCYRKIDGQPQGYVWGLMDPQREINARRSKALWALNNRQTIFERNAIRDKTELASEMARMDGQIEVENGKFDKFQVKENQDISQGNLTMLQEAKLAIRRISGEDMMNPAPEVRSGVGIQRLQMVQQAGVLPIYDNIRHSRRMKARLTFELIKQYYTEEMVFQITEDPTMVRTVKIPSTHFEALQEEIYDLVAEDTVDHSTTQAEQYETLATTLPQIIQYGPGWGKLLIAASDLRNKQGLMKMIDQMSQPPPSLVKPSVAFVWNELTPMEKAALAMQFQWAPLAQVEMKGGSGDPTSLAKEKASLLKQTIKSKTDIQKALINAGSSERAAALSHHAALETASMDNITALHQQRMQNQSDLMQAQMAADSSRREGGTE